MRPVKLVLMWHMHQPDYRHYDTRVFEMPWVYLHAIKDYTDMACHLETHPQIKAVVNFVPILLDQIEDGEVKWKTVLKVFLGLPILRISKIIIFENDFQRTLKTSQFS